MNQATYKLQKNPNKWKRVLAPTTTFWLLSAAIILFLYLPLFVGEYNLRQNQIERSGGNATGTLPVLGIDSTEYSTLATNLVEQKEFTLGNGPETFRSIGYPALVALYLARGLPIAAFPIIQMLMAVLTAYGIFLIGKTFWKPSVGIFASILYLIDPVTIVSSLTIATDIFYVLLLVYAFYFFFTSNINEKTKWAIGGLFLGFSTLVRPISMFLLIVFVLMYILKTYRLKRSFKTIVIPVLLCCVVYASVVVPYVVRNKKVSGVYGISTVKSYNLYHYYIPEFLSYKKGISTTDARLEVGKGLGVFDERSLANASKMEKRAKEFLFDMPISYGFFHIIKTIPFFISSGIETLFTNYNDASGEEVLPTIKENLTSLLLSGKIGSVFKIVSENPVIGAEQIILGALWLLALLSVYISYKRKELSKILLLWVVILYFALLTGPVAYSRYRLPATPFLFLLATYAIVIRSYAPPHNHPETR